MDEPHKTRPGDPGPYGGPPLYRPLPATDGPSIAATVCGVVSILIGWIPFVGVIGLGVAVAAVITGVIGVRRPGERVLAIVGLVTGGLTIAVWSVGLVVLAVQIAQGRLPS